jgi:hypothetical protein
MIYNKGVSFYFGAVRKCSREIFYLKKFLLACGTKGSLAVLGYETCVNNLKLCAAAACDSYIN